LALHFLRNKKILITGATGLVGSHTLQRLRLASCVDVIAVSHVTEPRVFADNISYVSADLTNPEDCRRIVKDVDYMLMFACRIDRKNAGLNSLVPNFTMNCQMLDAAYKAGVKKVLWLSSAIAYPPLDNPAKEEQMFDADPCDCCFPVGWLTRYIETVCRMYATKLQRQMPIIVLRPTAIYGEYCDFDLSSCHVLPALIRKVIERQNPLEIYGDGNTKRDFIYAGDVVEACLRALEKIDCYTELNICSGNLCSVSELLSLILDVDNYSDTNVIYKSCDFVKATSIAIDNTKARKIIGFECNTSLREGIVQTINWFRKTHGLQLSDLLKDL